MAAILNFDVKMRSYDNKGFRFGILMVELYEKVYPCMILGHLDQKLIFSDGAGRHFEFGPLGKNAGIFVRGMGAKSFIKCP